MVVAVDSSAEKSVRLFAIELGWPNGKLATG